MGSLIPNSKWKFVLPPGAVPKICNPVVIPQSSANENKDKVKSPDGDADKNKN